MKTVIFISNFFNHHQRPLADAMADIVGEGFLFIETEEMPQERIEMGYKQAVFPKYVVTCKEFERYKDKYLRLIHEAEAVVYGHCPNYLMTKRLQQHKFSLVSSERFLKNGLWHRFFPTTRWKVWQRFIQYRHHPFYVLCKSAYLSQDLSLTGFPRSKCFRWGYFPEVNQYENIKKLIDEKRQASILWVARLMELKHPDLMLRMARHLKQDGFQFTLDMIGSGVMEAKLRQLMKKYELDDCVRMLGSMTPAEVRAHMEKASIFVFSSDMREGWGAVMNEAMNSGCAVVADRAIGSVPYLLEHGRNGLIYDTEEEAYRHVAYLLKHPKICRQYGAEAYQTMVQIWNAKVAANRLVHIMKELMEHADCTLYATGPCSNENTKH